MIRQIDFRTYEKQCYCCTEWKLFVEANFRKAWGTDTLRNICKVCENTHANATRFNLTGKEKRVLVNTTQHCPICSVELTKPIRGVKGAKLKHTAVIDHDHKTGKFRGVLCNSCNRGLGLLGDSAENLERAIKYLNSHS